MTDSSASLALHPRIARSASPGACPSLARTGVLTFISADHGRCTAPIRARQRAPCVAPGSRRSLCSAGKTRARVRAGSGRAEDALEDRVDVGGVVAEVEKGGEFRGREGFRHVRVGLQELQEIATLAPHAHGIALHEAIAVLARDALVGERDQHALGVHEAAEAIEIGLHVLRIDDELLDQACCAVEREVERHGRVRSDHAFDRGVRNVALVPERNVLQGRGHVAAHHAGEAGDVLAQHGIALVGHGGRALLPFGEGLLRFQNLGALQVADLDREALQGRGDDAERREIHGMAVARDHLRRDRLGLEPELGRHVGLDARIDVGEGADGARDGAGADLLAGHDEARLGTVELGIGLGELEAEGRGFGVDAVAAADGGGELVLEGARLERREQAIDVGDEHVGGAHELHGETGIEDI